jgi:hypothetical protein
MKDRWMTEAMDNWASEGEWILQAVDQGAIEGVMDVISDGSWRNPWSDWSGTLHIIVHFCYVFMLLKLMLFT